MLRFYIPVLILQAFCLYHAYKNQSEQRWLWIILFFPLFGCLIYLYDAFYSRRNLAGITETVQAAVTSNYKIEKLEKEWQFSDNVATKTRLADAYAEVGRYKDAIKLYNSCLEGFMADDPVLQMKLLDAYFADEDFPSTIKVGEKLESASDFKNSPEKIAYAWALHHAGQSELAEKTFEAMDKPFTNYQHRWQYCQFLSETDRIADLKEKVRTLVTEFNEMGSNERKLNKSIISDATTLHISLNRKKTAAG